MVLWTLLDLTKPDRERTATGPPISWSILLFYRWFSKETGIGKTTIWRRFKGLVQGKEKASGGRNKGRTLKPDAEALLASRIGE